MVSQGRAAVYSTWLSQLSCALQKANVAGLRLASARGRPPVPGTRAEGIGVAANDLEKPEDQRPVYPTSQELEQQKMEKFLDSLDKHVY